MPGIGRPRDGLEVCQLILLIKNVYLYLDTKLGLGCMPQGNSLPFRPSGPSPRRAVCGPDSCPSRPVRPSRLPTYRSAFRRVLGAISGHCRAMPFCTLQLGNVFPGLFRYYASDSTPVYSFLFS